MSNRTIGRQMGEGSPSWWIPQQACAATAHRPRGRCRATRGDGRRRRWADDDPFFPDGRWLAYHVTTALVGSEDGARTAVHTVRADANQQASMAITDGRFARMDPRWLTALHSRAQ